MVFGPKPNYNPKI
ncbi:hypothetical protein F383_36929 [Gossypium arboreum]|nr:hypothetical protein F383_36929 [Gossypium arboreum]